jgi:hypothetical protein
MPVRCRTWHDYLDTIYTLVITARYAVIPRLDTILLDKVRLGDTRASSGVAPIVEYLEKGKQK